MRIIFTHNLSFLVMDVPDVKNEIKKIFLGVFSEINDFEFIFKENLLNIKT